jgi:hypothetical protein
VLPARCRLFPSISDISSRDNQFWFHAGVKIPCTGHSGELSGGSFRGAVHLPNLDQMKREKEVNRNCIKTFLGGAIARILCGSLAALAVLAVPGATLAEDEQGEKL